MGLYHYVVRETEHFKVTRQGGGVVLIALADNRELFFQGDNADELQAELDLIESDQVADDVLSQYLAVCAADSTMPDSY